MRVTENTNYDVIRDSIRRSRERMQDLQLQSSSLKKINTPSDDPISATKVLEMRTDKFRNDQFQLNSKMAEAFLNNTDHAISDLTEIVNRAKEIAINQSSAASATDETRLGVSEEVNQLLKQAISIANRKIGDRYLFGGFKTQTPPVDIDGHYLGDNGQIMVEIGNEAFISMNIPGEEVFNTHPCTERKDSQELLENVNVFEELQDLRITLLTGDLEGIRATLDRFDSINTKMIAARAKIGARIQGLQSATQAIERHNLTNLSLSSTLEDADMAQVVSDLGKEEMIFRSSLASSKRLIQPTLLDFLK